MPITFFADTLPSRAQPNAVDKPTSKLGRTCLGIVCKKSTQHRSSSNICWCDRRKLWREWVSLIEKGIETLSTPASTALLNPLRFGTRADTLSPLKLLANLAISGVSASWGRIFGDTKEPTSISCIPTSNWPWIHAFLTSVGITELKLCRPSLRPTSLTSTSIFFTEISL